MTDAMLADVDNVTNCSCAFEGDEYVVEKPYLGDGGIFNTGKALGSDLSQFIVQAVLIMSISRILHFGLRKLRQPRVIAEMLGGICLGPSILGNIPGFNDAIFPQSSNRLLALVANIGVVLYLFLVGLELNPGAFFRDLKRSAAISCAGIALSFVFGTGLSYGMHTHMLAHSDVPFTSFLVFMCLALAITGFPVLARILTEFKLLSTPVGLITITAAAIDDVVAAVLLSLVISIVHAKDRFMALYVFFVALGYTLLLLGPLRTLFKKAHERLHGLIHTNETMQQVVIVAVLILVFLSSWVSELIGMHASFGAFLIGLVLPRRSALPRQLIDKTEDLVSIVFLPLFFALSGLKTQLSLLNDLASWSWLFLIITIQCTSKIVGCTAAARLVGCPWRECWAIGVLMNTSGLVMLIVLNVGHDAHVIDDKIFVIMVVMALVTTFMTSPLIAIIYPPKARRQIPELQAKKQARPANDTTSGNPADTDYENVKMLVYVDRMESFPALVSILTLFKMGGKLELNALKIAEISERSSSILAEVQACEAHKKEPSLQVALLVGNILGVPTKAVFSTAPTHLYVDEVNKVVTEQHCNLFIIHWHYPSIHRVALEVVEMMHQAVLTTCILYEQQNEGDAWSDSSCRTIQRGILVPFIGGKDDCEALKIALRLFKQARINLDIIHVQQQPSQVPVKTVPSAVALAQKFAKSKVTIAEPQHLTPVPSPVSWQLDPLDVAALDTAKATRSDTSAQRTPPTLTFIGVEDPGEILVKAISLQDQYDLIITGRSSQYPSLKQTGNLPPRLPTDPTSEPCSNPLRRSGYGLSGRKGSASKKERGGNPLLFGKIADKMALLTVPVLIVHKPLARLASL